MNKGIFIVFEGPEGSGKSTHSIRIRDELVSGGYDVVHTAEPGGTELGAGIRELLLKKDDVRLDARAELLLFEADRAQHVNEVILPALNAGKIVLCDRFNTATFAYQGYALGMDMGMIKDVDDAATGGLAPDMVILMDVEAGTGLERAGNRCAADRMEKRGIDFHEKVREGYLDMAARSSGRIKVIKVADSIDDTYDMVREEVYGLIEGYKGAG